MRLYQASSQSCFISCWFESLSNVLKPTFQSTLQCHVNCHVGSVLELYGFVGENSVRKILKFESISLLLVFYLAIKMPVSRPTPSPIPSTGTESSKVMIDPYE